MNVKVQFLIIHYFLWPGYWERSHTSSLNINHLLLKGTFNDYTILHNMSILLKNYFKWHGTALKLLYEFSLLGRFDRSSTTFLK